MDSRYIHIIKEFLPICTVKITKQKILSVVSGSTPHGHIGSIISCNYAKTYVHLDGCNLISSELVIYTNKSYELQKPSYL